MSTARRSKKSVLEAPTLEAIADYIKEKQGNECSCNKLLLVLIIF
jgi:hypothetical protein